MQRQIKSAKDWKHHIYIQNNSYIRDNIRYLAENGTASTVPWKIFPDGKVKQNKENVPADTGNATLHDLEKRLVFSAFLSLLNWVCHKRQKMSVFLEFLYNIVTSL